MALKADRTRFLLKDEKRLRIAEWCARQPLSHSELAKRLGADYGSISAPRTMAGAKWKALLPAGKGGSWKAQLYKLNPAWKQAVREARQQVDLDAISGVKAALGDVDLLLVRLNDLAGACRVLAEIRSEVDWVAPVRGESIGLVIGISRGDGDVATARMVTAMVERSVAPGRLTIGDVLNREEAADWSQRVLANEQEPKALP